MLRLCFLVVAAMVSTSDARAWPSWQKPKAALLITDVQDCFLPGGSMAVPEGEDVIPVINRIRSQFGPTFPVVVFAQDWHPYGHISFASSHPNASVGDEIELDYLSNGTICIPEDDPTFADRFPTAVECDEEENTKTIDQQLWPEYCIQNEFRGPASSKIAANVIKHSDDMVVKKGARLDLDSYSAFFDQGQFVDTGLDKTLQEKGITHVFIMGLTLESTVYHTSLDALNLGYETYVVKDATRGVSPQTSARATSDMTSKGVNIVNAYELSEIVEQIYQQENIKRWVPPKWLQYLNRSWRKWNN